MRRMLGETQSEFAMRYHIPFRTVQNWENGVRQPPEYVMELLEQKVQTDLINRRTRTLPEYSPNKKNLPKRRDYVGALAWLRAVQEYIGKDSVFALDEALMCQGNFGGRSDEFLVWLYGDDALTQYNGVVVLGNRISDYDIQQSKGLRYTNFSRTVSDAFANEDILDMQGITEAISRYYYRNNESFAGISVAPQYQSRFDDVAKDALAYYGG